MRTQIELKPTPTDPEPDPRVNGITWIRWYRRTQADGELAVVVDLMHSRRAEWQRGEV